MKKILLLLTAILASAGIAVGQNALTVADITLPSNSDATLTVSYQFDVADSYTGYSFNLELPSELEFVIAEGTDVAVTKGACHDASHSVTANLDGGVVKVAGLSLSSKPLTGMSGALLTFTVRPKAAVTVGQTFTGNIKDILIVPVEGTKKSLAASTFTVTIGEPADLRTVLDETSTTVPSSATGVDIRVKRTIKANEWSTICLPFDMSAAQVKECFGDAVQLGDFDGTESEFDNDDNVVGIRVDFKSATAIEANHPYVIKVAQPVSEFTLDGVDIVADEEEAYIEFDNGKSGSRRVVYSGFYGTYHAQTVLEKFTLFLSENKFWYSMGLTKMKAFRAYFGILDILTEVEEAGVRVLVNFDGEQETRIDGVTTETYDGPVYDLSGRKVTDPQQHGVYIINGRKVLK